MNPDQTAAALAVAHAFMIQNGMTPPAIPAQEPTPADQQTTFFAEDPAPEPKAAYQPLASAPPPGPKQVSIEEAMSRDVKDLIRSLNTRSIGPAAPLPTTTAPIYPTHTLSTPAGVGVMEQLLTEIGGLRASIDKLCMILGAR